MNIGREASTKLQHQGQGETHPTMDDVDTCDVTLLVGEEKQPLKAHGTVELPQFEFSSVKVVIEYLYTGKLNLAISSTSNESDTSTSNESDTSNEVDSPANTATSEDISVSHHSMSPEESSPDIFAHIVDLHNILTYFCITFPRYRNQLFYHLERMIFHEEDMKARMGMWQRIQDRNIEEFIDSALGSLLYEIEEDYQITDLILSTLNVKNLKKVLKEVWKKGDGEGWWIRSMFDGLGDWLKKYCDPSRTDECIIQNRRDLEALKADLFDELVWMLRR
ncbi:hypothetical protein HDV00_012650 [Rhizophlyctis rosea]|nr:hypothetical protein HDV00_012650 [Rhizophlyctis rosea]